MKLQITIIAALILCLEIFSGCSKKSSTSWQSVKNPEVTAQLKSFVAEKSAQANLNAPDAAPQFKPFFAAAQKGDWIGLSNAFVEMKKHAPQYQGSLNTDDRLRGTAWQTVIETWGTFEAVFDGSEKYSKLYADEIINSIPQGSIYFGGTDPGRFLITGMQKSHVNGDPFFTVTQNALADGTYLAYLREMYDGKIYTPDDDNLGKSFQDYQQDVLKRKQSNQLKPGENVTTDANGHLQISGQVSVMEINGLLAKIIFEQNSNRECYVEESFPLDWMYPYEEPHGVIMKINRQPLTQLSDEIVQRDEDYWSNLISPMIGNWLNKDTSLNDVLTFAEKVYVKNDLSGFTGDKEFIQNDYAQKMFSKERTSIAGLYTWRAQQTTDPVEKQRMNDAADFAFRQAFALCPNSPEAVFRYVNLLMSENRNSDALLIAETATKLPQMKDSNGSQIRDLVYQLKRNAK